MVSLSHQHWPASCLQNSYWNESLQSRKIFIDLETIAARSRKKFIHIRIFWFLWRKKQQRNSCIFPGIFRFMRCSALNNNNNNNPQCLLSLVAGLCDAYYQMYCIITNNTVTNHHNLPSIIKVLVLLFIFVYLNNWQFSVLWPLFSI